MDHIFLNSITTDAIDLPVLNDSGIKADVLRLDRIHPFIPGNKWFKLRYYLDDVIRCGKKKIITFGGAWSNHIIATAAISRSYGLQATGIIRGERPAIISSTLQQAKALGMQLVFISREEYKQKKVPPGSGNDHYIINEGGYGKKGAEGAATILEHCQRNNYTHIACATGTGTMAAGLAMEAGKKIQVIAVSVLKGHDDLASNIFALTGKTKTNTRVIHDYHFGGYAKHTPALLNFMNDLYRQTSVPTDFVYTGKLFYGIADMAAKKYFAPGSRLLLIHSGGIQGNTSLDNGTLIF